ncbi:ribonuclease HII [Hyphomicrobiales bacterium]|nr:ribonuclease HII [Hyphomicrobiales bacterium]MDG1152137.1 ribonuclease HII [Hyphomicrobiales bacterium]
MERRTSYCSLVPDNLNERDIGWPKKLIAGIDEAGRGPWAGPVVSAAVILNEKNIPDGLNDSKKLSEKKRLSLYSSIYNFHFVGVGISSIEEIDSMNVLQATFLSMKRAVEDLNPQPEYILVDGNLDPGLNFKTKCIIKGDSISISIAAASVIAKVTRDNLMLKLDKEFPNYNWKKNKGYGTAEHRNALELHGPCKYHRKSFSPINKMLGVN